MREQEVKISTSSVPVVDVGAEVDRVMREMAAAGIEDEDGDADPWPAIPD